MYLLYGETLSGKILYLKKVKMKIFYKRIFSTNLFIKFKNIQMEKNYFKWGTPNP
jgi:hypothetical protein